MRIFEKPTLDREDSRQDHGEVRVNSVGEIGGLVVANVTHTDRDGNTRLISARAATPVERSSYREFERELSGERPRRRGQGKQRDDFPL